MYMCGADGTGKSTQTRRLLDQLEAEGVAPLHRWMRFPFLVSVPLLAYAKLRGWSWYEQTGDVRHGYWDFRRSVILRTLLPWTLLMDAALTALRRVYIPLWRGRTIVCERFVLDMLVDLSVALSDPHIHHTLPGRWYPRLIPRGSGVVVLDLDAATIRARRADLQMDHRLEERLAMFRTLARDLSLPVICSAGPIEAVQRTLGEQMRTEAVVQPKGYAKVRSATLRRALRHPVVAVASHWALQSTLYMDRTERRFKIALDGALTLVLVVALRRWLGRAEAWTGAFVFAHTLNFLFNGHLWGILKHWGWVHFSYEDWTRYYETFHQRVQAEPSVSYAAVYGSLARGDWKPSSDLDVRMVRRPGWRNGVRACAWTLRERSRALLHGFPLDLYVVDSWDALVNMHLEHTPTVLVDRSEAT
jgi:predicted nucleotidyltransferase